LAKDVVPKKKSKGLGSLSLKREEKRGGDPEGHVPAKKVLQSHKRFLDARSVEPTWGRRRTRGGGDLYQDYGRGDVGWKSQKICVPANLGRISHRSQGLKRGAPGN